MYTHPSPLRVVENQMIGKLRCLKDGAVRPGAMRMPHSGLLHSWAGCQGLNPPPSPHSSPRSFTGTRPPSQPDGRPPASPLPPLFSLIGICPSDCLAHRTRSYRLTHTVPKHSPPSPQRKTYPTQYHFTLSSGDLALSSPILEQRFKNCPVPFPRELLACLIILTLVKIEFAVHLVPLLTPGCTLEPPGGFG